MCTYEAAIDVIRAPQLPGGLPDGVTLAEAIQIVVTDDGQSLDPLPANARITVKFEIPAGQQSATYAILFWDDGKWVELSGEMTDDGFFTAAAENAGTFVLVKK